MRGRARVTLVTGLLVLGAAAVALPVAALVGFAPRPASTAPSTTASQPAGLVESDTLFPVTHVETSETRAAWSREFGIRIGALFATVPPWPDAEVEALIRSDPDPDAPVVALYRAWREPEYGSELRASRAGVSGGVSRFGHEEYGFAVHRRWGDWLEIAFGIAADGSVQRGWVHLPGSGMHFRTSLEKLSFCGAYLVDPAAVRFHREPGGQEESVPPDHPLRRAFESGDDHLAGRLEVLETLEAGERPGLASEWLRVRAESSEDARWVPLRDSEGRIQLLYDVGHCSPTQEVADRVPVGTLAVHGTFRDDRLEVRSHEWRIALRSRGASTAGTREEDAPIRARLLDADGELLVERAAFPAEPRGEPVEPDVPEVGAFSLSLGIEDPSRVAALEVEAEGRVHRVEAMSTVHVSLDDPASRLTEPVSIDVTLGGPVEGVRAELHGAHTSGRALPSGNASLHIDPSRYGRGPIHIVVLVTDGIAADLAHRSSEIAVDFAEHLEIHLDGIGDTLRVPAGQTYLHLEPLVARYTSPSESRMEIPFPGGVSFESDVDGPLRDRDLSPDHPELYLDLRGLPPGPRRLVMRAELDGLRAERSLVLELRE